MIKETVTNIKNSPYSMDTSLKVSMSIVLAPSHKQNDNELMDVLLSKTLLTLERIAMQHRGNGVAGRMRYFIIRARECTLPA